MGRALRSFVLVGMLAGLMAPSLGRAALYVEETGDQTFRLDGRIRQEFDVGYGRRFRGGKVQPIGSEYLVELSSNFSYLDWMRAKVVLNFWGDSMYKWREHSRTFGDQNVDVRTGNNRAFVPYGEDSETMVVPDGCKNSSDCSNFLRDYLIREASVVFSDRSAGYNVTIGKFQRGWGQADGLRLMDVLNPLDFRKRFLLRDFDELRIEQWMADAVFFLDPYVSTQQFGIYNPQVEFVWIPNVRHTEFRINNAFDHEGGGIWGFHLPTRGFSPAGPLPDRVFLHLNRVTAGGKDWWSWENPVLAGRLAWRMFKTDFTVAGYYGWQDLFVTRLQSAEIHLGPDGRAPMSLNPPPFNQPVDPATAAGAFQLVNAGAIDLATCTADPAVGLPLPPLGSPGIPGGCSVVSNIDLDFRERKKLMGFTATRDMSEIVVPPKGVSPVFRLEMSYEFEKPFNTVTIVGPDHSIPAGGGFPRIPGAVAKHDFASGLFGVDLPLWFPDSFYGNAVLDTPRAMFTSFQVFWFKAMGNGTGDRRVLWQSPYVDWKRPANEFWFTFLWSYDVYRSLIHLEGLNIYDLNNSGYILRQRADFRFFGDMFVPRVEVGHFEGKGDQSAGVFDANDYMSLGMTMQF